MKDKAQKLYEQKLSKNKNFYKNSDIFNIVSFGNISYMYIFLYLIPFDKGLTFFIFSIINLFLAMIGIFKTIKNKKLYGVWFGIVTITLMLINIFIYIFIILYY